MARKILISATLLALLAWTRVCAAAPDYIDQLTRLSQLASDGQYQQAMGGAASEFEIADLHDALHETDEAIASLGRSVQLGYDDCLTPRTSEHPAGMLKNPAVLYRRQQLLLMQRAQREFVKSSDGERMVHAATMGIVSGSSPSAALESARLAHAAAESRRAEVRKRAFVLPASASGQAKSCSELAAIPR